MQWALVLAGGIGSRFWPASTPHRPKQLLPLAGDQPLIVDAVRRLEGLVPAERTLLITGEALAPVLSDLLPELPVDNILIEPEARSTGPALTWATARAARQDPDAVILSMHADWVVHGQEAFRATARRAMEIAETHDTLVTVGVGPTRPDPGFGYIVRGPPLAEDVWRVERFVEKPPVAEAERLMAEGALWNSGLFAWTAARLETEIRQHAPELEGGFAAVDGEAVDAFFRGVQPIAIDHAVLERSDRLAVLPASFAWDDVGTWASVSRVHATDADGNVVVGPATLVDVRDSVIWNEGGPVVVSGLDHVVVVHANGAVLVTTKERAEDLKRILDHLPPEQRDRS